MADINSFVFTGRLTNDATYRVLASGKAILNCSVANNIGFGDFKKTIFLKVQQWGTRSQTLVQYLKKGTLIGGVGELSRSEWADAEGKLHVDFVVDTYNLQLLGKYKNSDITDSINSVSIVESSATDDSTIESDVPLF